MVSELILSRQRGGNHHPLSVNGFIIAHLTMYGEDYIANIHRAYKAALVQLALDSGRKHAYHKPVYSSMEKAVNKLAREGVVEFSGREEESDNPMFANRDWIPIRRYYRLGAGAGTGTDHRNGYIPGFGQQNGHKKQVSQDGSAPG